MKSQFRSFVKNIHPNNPANLTSTLHRCTIKYLRGLKHVAHPLSCSNFTPPAIQSTSYCLSTSQVKDFIEVRDRFATCQESFNVSVNSTTGVLDNSANVHVLRDKSLFTSDTLPCPVGLDVGTVVGSDPPTGIGAAQMAWCDDEHNKNSLQLCEALYYPNSPVNVISITKLGMDASDKRLNIQTFPTHSIFTWNQGSSSILFRHSRGNIPEFSILTNFDPLACLVNHHQSKESTMSLSKADELALFEAAPQS